MKLLVLNVLLALLLCQEQMADTQIGTILRMAGKGVNVARFASNLMPFLFLRDTTTKPQLLLQVSQLVKKSSDDIQMAIVDTMKNDKIYEALRAIHSSMVDLKIILLAVNNQEKRAYEAEFVKNYVHNQVLMHSRFLPEMLTLDVPGFDTNLAEYVKRKTNCNVTGLEEFTDAYLDILSNAIALNSVYYALTKNATFTNTISHEWEATLVTVQNVFDGIERSCMKEMFEKSRYCASAADVATLGTSVLLVAGGLMIVSSGQ